MKWKLAVFLFLFTVLSSFFENSTWMLAFSWKLATRSSPKCSAAICAIPFQRNLSHGFRKPTTASGKKCLGPAADSMHFSTMYASRKYIRPRANGRKCSVKIPGIPDTIGSGSRKHGKEYITLPAPPPPPGVRPNVPSSIFPTIAHLNLISRTLPLANFAFIPCVSFPMEVCRNRNQGKKKANFPSSAWMATCKYVTTCTPERFRKSRLIPGRINSKGNRVYSVIRSLKFESCNLSLKRGLATSYKIDMEVNKIFQFEFNFVSHSELTSA